MVLETVSTRHGKDVSDNSEQDRQLRNSNANSNINNNNNIQVYLIYIICVNYRFLSLTLATSNRRYGKLRLIQKRV